MSHFSSMEIDFVFGCDETETFCRYNYICIYRYNYKLARRIDNDYKMSRNHIFFDHITYCMTMHDFFCFQLKIKYCFIFYERFLLVDRSIFEGFISVFFFNVSIYFYRDMFIFWIRVFGGYLLGNIISLFGMEGNYSK